MASRCWRSRRRTVTKFDTPDLHKLIDDMFESMYAAKGVGLAAPQIGIRQRIAVIDLSVAEDPRTKDRSHQPGDHPQRAASKPAKKAASACPVFASR